MFGNSFCFRAGDVMNLQSYWYWLTTIKGFGKISINKVIDYYQTPDAVYYAPDDELREVLIKFCQVKAPIVKRVLNKKPITYYEREIEAYNKRGISLVTVTDEAYPDKLRHIYDSPKVLYTKGILPDFNQLCIGIVGARKCSAYGAHMANQIARKLIEAGVHVISGMARGIDGVAHKGALEAMNDHSESTTIGILGCGLDIVYPKEHSTLYKKVAAKGCLISEYPVDAAPIAANFPLRNRIISSLSDGILVVEAKKSSGSLITAHYGLEQGKDIFALPGRTTDPMSEGTNHLIKAGAKIVLDVEDILEEYGIDCNIHLKKEVIPNLDKDEASIYKLVSYDPTSIESLCNTLGIKAEEIALCVLKLELKGLIRYLPNKQIVKK